MLKNFSPGKGGIFISRKNSSREKGGKYYLQDKPELKKKNSNYLLEMQQGRSQSDAALYAKELDKRPLKTREKNN
jgi:hypothetical protein